MVGWRAFAEGPHIGTGWQLLAQRGLGFPAVTGLESALGAMQLRSRAQFGDKTILDGLRAVIEACRSAADMDDLGTRAATAARAVAAYRDKPSQIGRARLAEGRGIGLDDPGMVALANAIEVARPPSS